ncbi:MAG: transcriptional repressor [Ruminococcaceae bacterium]|nr:transcriptional repressor [Oscillospiraceae bacterium]
MRSSTYNTSGRMQLTDFLARNVHKQYSVQALHAALAKEGIAIGKSSLYRQLERLCEEGVVRKFRDAEKDLSFFQYIGSDEDCAKHLHLKCRTCGKLIHLHCDAAGELVAHIAAEHGFAIDSKKSVLYGTCKECGGQKNG